MSCMFVMIDAGSKAALLNQIKKHQKRGVSVRKIAVRKLKFSHGYAAVLQVCNPSSSKPLLPEARSRATAGLKRWFGLTK